ncbi:uncharacterized protein EDB91DRAFT_1255324 [Suillus paluster]|uniref:uncharacterized protein n=1 Tax=Suillus paluster TaxID=48578 RepID=UPI001B87A1FF|nr:uncharacterized protein EDB91DRAFT_1255324 [Suillus paluster]KAG1724232.1 hypothetical protein EDB91DRAFT_1255324 [Suillus paluster]
MDHIMPIDTTNSHDPLNQVSDCATGAYSLKWLGSTQGEQHTKVTDVKILFASEFISSVQYDPPLHDECRFRHNAFVYGCTSHYYGGDPVLYVDLEQDVVALLKDEIEISVDIGLQRCSDAGGL